MKSKYNLLKTLGVVLILCFFVSCQKKEKISDKSTGEGMPKVQSVSNAGNAWKSVSLLVLDKKKTNDKGTKFEANIAGDFVLIPGTKIKIKVDQFFPDFFIDGNVPSSRGEELNNPAVHIIVEEEGKPQYQGWLFANYPDVHEFPHDSITVRLADYIKK